MWAALCFRAPFAVDARAVPPPKIDMALARLATSWSKWTPLALAAALLLLLVAPDRAQAAGEQTYFVLCASAGAAKPFALGQTSSARDRVCSALSSPSGERKRGQRSALGALCRGGQSAQDAACHDCVALDHLPADSYAPSLWTDLQAAQPALSLVQSTAFSESHAHCCGPCEGEPWWPALHVGPCTSRGWWPPAWCKDCTHALSCANNRVAAGWNQGTPPTLGAGGNLISKASLSSIAVTLDASAPLAPEVRTWSLSLSCHEGKLHRGVRCNLSALARWCSAAQILTQVMAARVVPTAFIFNTASGGSGPAPTSLWRLGNVAVWNVTTTINAGARPSYKLDLVPQSASYRVWTFDNAGTPIKYNLATCFAAPSYTVNNADTC